MSSGVELKKKKNKLDGINKNLIDVKEISGKQRDMWLRQLI